MDCQPIRTNENQKRIRQIAVTRDESNKEDDHGFTDSDENTLEGEHEEQYCR